MIKLCDLERGMARMAGVLVLQHSQCEPLGTIAYALAARGLLARVVRGFEGEKIPDGMAESAGLVVMGGPMSVYEQARYPFLREEIRLVEQALKSQVPVLGVCLGSQLLAAALGSKVIKGERKEIGWHPVTLTAAACRDRLWRGITGPFTAYHWHGDVFELPRGAESLASSALTPCQAFRYGENGYGFLFHMEVTDEIIGGMVRTFAEELEAERLDREEVAGMAANYLPGLQGIGKMVFGRWAGLVSAAVR